MSTFKECIKPFGIKYKFWFAIKNWSDQDIVEFLQEDIFNCKDFTLTFDEAKIKCNESLGKSIDTVMAVDDQRELYRSLQTF
jgi:hypothetical protein